MKKKSLVLVVSTVLCLAMAGCQAKEESNKTTVSNEKKQETKKEETIEVKDLSKATSEEAWVYAEEIIQTIQEKAPVFGDYQVSVVDFGAISKDGEITKEEERKIAMDNTKAIYAAICDVNKQEKGGTVNVPAGTWYTAAIHLKSNVNLHLEEGATLKFATDTDLYAGEFTKELYGSELTFVRNGGIELYNYSPFIYAKGENNIAVTGKGTIDGQAKDDYWLAWKTLGETESNNELLKMGETGVPVEERKFGESDGEPGKATDGFIRPNFVEFIDCDSVLIEGITTTNSPAWQIHPVYCNYVTVKDVNINTPTGPNSDGVDPDSCKYVLIDGNTFNTGDDCIAIKSGKNEDGRRVNIASENIVIQNNTMQIGHGAITLGSEASAGIRNVFARNNTLKDASSECCFRFKNSTLRGNTLENIFYKDTNIEAFRSKKDMIVFESDYGVEDETEYLKAQGIKIEERKPVTRNVYIDNFHMKSEVWANNAIRMEGVESCPIENVHFTNFEIGKVEKVMELSYVDGLTVENMTVTRNKAGDTFTGCKNFSFKNINYQEAWKSSEADFSAIENLTSENITITGK